MRPSDSTTPSDGAVDCAVDGVVDVAADDVDGTGGTEGSGERVDGVGGALAAPHKSVSAMVDGCVFWIFRALYVLCSWIGVLATLSGT